MPAPRRSLYDYRHLRLGAPAVRSRPNLASRGVHYPKRELPDIADAIADGRRPTGMNTDEEIVYDFTTELQKNKRVSDPTFNRAMQRFGKKAVVDLTGISGYYAFLAMQLNMARYEFSGASPRLPQLMTC